jgi:LacI family transcriptional regulator
MMGHATIRDVARRAQLSVASVSRALNGSSSVRAETRERVLAVASELGYVPHAGARSLSLARTHAIGVVLPDLHGEFFSEIVRGMDREASARGYLLLLSSIHRDAGHATDALRTMRGRVDGMLVMAPHIDADVLAQALTGGMPAVLINPPAPIEGHTAFRIDNGAGVDAVVSHLIALGKRRIAHIRGPEDNVDASERAQSFEQALAARGSDTHHVIVQGDFSEAAGAAAVEQIFGVRCDAVFAANDMMAIGCLHELRSRGVRVPEDVAIVGFDDVPLARYLGLTTVRVHIAEMGARAVMRLLAMIGRGESAGDELHRPELIVRNSTTSERVS